MHPVPAKVMCLPVKLFMIGLLLSFHAVAQGEEEKKKDFTKIRPGMSELQVKKTVGEPEKIELFKTVRTGTRDTTTYWRYENDLTVIFKNHYVEGVEPDHALLLQHIQEWADPKNKEGIKLLYK